MNIFLYETSCCIEGHVALELKLTPKPHSARENKLWVAYQVFGLGLSTKIFRGGVKFPQIFSKLGNGAFSLHFWPLSWKISMGTNIFLEDKMVFLVISQPGGKPWRAGSFK